MTEWSFRQRPDPAQTPEQAEAEGQMLIVEMRVRAPLVAMGDEGLALDLKGEEAVARYYAFIAQHFDNCVLLSGAPDDGGPKNQAFQKELARFIFATGFYGADMPDPDKETT